MLCIKLPGKDIVICRFHYQRFPTSLHHPAWDGPSVETHGIQVLQEVPVVRDQNPLSLGISSLFLGSALIKWRENNTDILENAS